MFEVIHIYTKDKQGLIKYMGGEEWQSREQFCDHYFLPKEGRNEALLGWPHASVTWHGSIGFGEHG